MSLKSLSFDPKHKVLVTAEPGLLAPIYANGY